MSDGFNRRDPLCKTKYSLNRSRKMSSDGRFANTYQNQQNYNNAYDSKCNLDKRDFNKRKYSSGERNLNYKYQNQNDYDEFNRQSGSSMAVNVPNSNYQSYGSSFKNNVVSRDNYQSNPPRPNNTNYRSRPIPEENKDNKIATNYSRKNSISSKSHHSNYEEYVSNYNKRNYENNCCGHNSNNPFESNLLCQDCINLELMKMKNRRNEKEIAENEGYKIPAFTDKYKEYTQDQIRNKVQDREDQAKLVADYMNKYKSKDKANFIDKRENEPNFMNSVNSNYLYERAKRNRELKEEMMNRNRDKYTNPERPEVASYFNHYVNNENYKDLMKIRQEEDAMNREKDLRAYKNDLLEQIDYKNRQRQKEIENDERMEREQYELAMRQARDENERRRLREEYMKNKLKADNLELINEKLRRKRKEEEDEQRDDEMMRQVCQRQNEIENEKEYQKKLRAQRFYEESMENIQRNRDRKAKEEEEDAKYRYYDDYICHHNPEEIGVCMNCKRTFPRRLLTVNKYFYDNHGR